MCVVSMIGDHYADKWRGLLPPAVPSHPVLPPAVTKEEFEALKRDVAEMKKLLKRAKLYDAQNGQPDCEMDEKVELLKKIAAIVGVDLSDVLKGKS